MTEFADTPPCIAAGCTRPHAPGARLCQFDLARLGDWIARIGDEYAQLDAVPSMQGRELGTIGRSGLASQRSPASLDVIALRDRRSRDRDRDDPDGNATRGVLEVLASWAQVVREERGLDTPTTIVEHTFSDGSVWQITVPTAATVLSERRVLSTHFDWIVAQDWVDELYADLRAVWTQVRAQTVGRPGYVARCGCGGRIRWGDGRAACQACGTTVTATEVAQQARENAEKEGAA